MRWWFMTDEKCLMCVCYVCAALWSRDTFDFMCHEFSTQGYTHSHAISFREIVKRIVHLLAAKRFLPHRITFIWCKWNSIKLFREKKQPFTSDLNQLHIWILNFKRCPNKLNIFLFRNFERSKYVLFRKLILVQKKKLNIKSSRFIIFSVEICVTVIESNLRRETRHTANALP